MSHDLGKVCVVACDSLGSCVEVTITPFQHIGSDIPGFTTLMLLLLWKAKLPAVVVCVWFHSTACSASHRLAPAYVCLKCVC